MLKMFGTKKKMMREFIFYRLMSSSLSMRVSEKGAVMTVTKYLQNKYGMTDKTKVSTDFILIETLMTKKEMRKTLPGVLGIKTCPNSLDFQRFCFVCEEYINVPETDIKL